MQRRTHKFARARIRARRANSAHPQLRIQIRARCVNTRTLVRSQLPLGLWAGTLLAPQFFAMPKQCFMRRVRCFFSFIDHLFWMRAAMAAPTARHGFRCICGCALLSTTCVRRHVLSFTVVQFYLLVFVASCRWQSPASAGRSCYSRILGYVRC